MKTICESGQIHIQIVKATFCSNKFSIVSCVGMANPFHVSQGI